jgi:hypothetical protein
LSAADAFTETAPDTVAPAPGAVIVTVGNTASCVTVSIAVATLFAASRAVTVMTFDPGCRATPVADQLVVPVADPLPPALFTQVIWVTPTLSAAVPLTVNADVLVVYVADEVGPVMATVGAVTSGAVYVTVSVLVATLFTASRAVTVTMLVPG